MRVLVLGSGGREHALCWGLSRSPQLRKLFILPGNAGTARLGTNIPGDPADVKLVVDVARREQIDLVVVGPEDPLAAGVVDALRAQGIRAFGPTAAAAKLEADKAYAKQFMRQHAIPTAEARIFDDYRLAREYIATRDEALVVKAAGLAKGKGVIVCDDPSDAILAAENMLVKRAFGAAGDTIVVEEKLAGVETSLLCLVDGHTLYVLDPAQDYKRLRDGDQGPNTGGMGCYCPTNTITPEVLRQIETQILVPTLDALVREEVVYRGLLYVGLMLTLAGPKVLEFNCRFGDPETQVIIPRMRADLLEVLGSVADGRLEGVQIDWDPRHAVCVVAASEGYPDNVATGRLIRGLGDVAEGEDLIVFHAGTKLQAGDVATSGGRVLNVTALADTRAAAAQKAYAALEKIRFEGMQYRKDIAAGA
jgi:phosphoribosylamine--glycine ligase